MTSPAPLWRARLRAWLLCKLDRARDWLDPLPPPKPTITYRCKGTRSAEDEFVIIARLCDRGDVRIDLNGYTIRGLRLVLGSRVHLTSGRLECTLPILWHPRSRECLLSNLDLAWIPEPSPFEWEELSRWQGAQMEIRS